jgi:hypothetical protein
MVNKAVFPLSDNVSSWPHKQFMEHPISLLEKRFIVAPAIHFWYVLITVTDIKNELLFFCIG